MANEVPSTPGLRLGITGTENSHAEAIISLVRRGKLPGARVVAISGGDSTRTRQLAALDRGITVVDDPTELLDEVDAVLICDRDGGEHRSIATPFLEHRTPVYIDKPFTRDLDHARALIEAAALHDALLTSYSPLRYVPEVSDLAAIARGLDKTCTVEVSGPADPASPFGGIFFYGSHHADIALRLAPGPVGSVVQVQRTAAGWSAEATAGGRNVLLHFANPERDRAFRVRLRRGQTEVKRCLSLGPEFFQPGLRVFLDSVRTGVAPLTGDEMIRPVQLLTRVAEQLAV